MNTALKLSLRTLGINPDDPEVARTIAVFKLLFRDPRAGTWDGAHLLACSPVELAALAVKIDPELRPADPLAWGTRAAKAVRDKPVHAKALYNLRGQL